jgi:hypothetical protein
MICDLIMELDEAWQIVERDARPGRATSLRRHGLNWADLGSCALEQLSGIRTEIVVANALKTHASDRSQGFKTLDLET